MAVPEGAHENLKSESAQPLIPVPAIASAAFRISGLTSIFVAAPPSTGAVQNSGIGEGRTSQSQTHTEILFPSGCQAAEIVQLWSVRCPSTSWGGFPSKPTT